MPGLLRGMARTTMIVGTATAVSGSVARRQNARWQQQEAAAAPAPAAAAPSDDDVYVELEKLGQLKDQGILTQEEFDAKKKQLLGL